MSIFRSGTLFVVLIFGALLFSISDSFGQLTVTGGLTANDLAQILAGPGVSVSNATLTGSTQASGSFDGSASNIGMNSGVLLTTGPLNIAIGPNNTESAGLDLFLPGNNLLNGLAGATTFDAIIFEFDFIPLSNQVQFNYVFGSEEYLEWVNSDFNDAFAFYISGPGIAGEQNIALVPGTTTPITINTINNGTNAQYYVNNPGGASIQYDGFTTVMTALATVQACETYRLRLMIADGGDGVWDSGVFLEEASLTSVVVEITATTATADTTAYENCSNATVTFTLSETISTDYVVNYTVSGTATSGIDFPAIPTSVTIPANTLSTSFLIEPTFDGVIEGVETVIIDVQTSVCGSDSILIYINDVSPVTVEAFGDTAFCGGTAKLWASAQGGSGGYTYTWSNGMTTDTIYVNPTTTTTYTVISNDFCSSTVPEPMDSTTVTIDPTPVANAGPDIIYCAGDAVTLSGTGGNLYLWAQLPGPMPLGNTASATLNPVGDVDYEMITWIGSCSDTDFVSITELPASPANAVGDTLICGGQSVQINVVDAVNSTFSWSPIIGLTDPLIQNPDATPSATTVYIITVTSTSGCVKTDSVEIIINPAPVADFLVADVCLNAPSIFQNQTTIQSGNIQTYAWNFGDAATSPNSDPGNIYATDGTFTVKLVAVSTQGCADSITQITTVNPLPTANFTFANDCEDKAIPFVNTSSVPSGNIVLWDWNFGNIQTSEVENPPVQLYPADGFYDVQLTVTTEFNCIDTITQTVEVFPVPIANFEFDSVCLGFENQFTNLSNPNGNYAINNWDWLFEDGQTSTEQNPNIYFDQHGIYNATLTILNTEGCLSEITLGNVVVHPTPISQFDNAIKNCLNDTTWFIDLSTVAVQLNDEIISWNWDLADGNTSTNQNTQNVYADFGFYPVTLTTVTDKGCENSVTYPIEIFPLPSIAFSSDVIDGCQPLGVQFEDLVTIPAPYFISQWIWNLGRGDGAVSVQNPFIIYNNDTLADLSVGNHTVSLQATSGNGCISTDTVQNYITEYPKPDALFSANPWVTNVLSPKIDFTDLSTQNVVEWNWEFGNNGFGDQQHPTYSYPQVGQYDVTQYVTTEYDCLDTAYGSVKVEPIYTFYIPSSFTPNADGINEYFFGTGEGISSYAMYIYNRWGELIFTSLDQEYQWNGSYKGRQVQQGTYIYYFKVIDWKKDDHEYRGHVTLIR